jgi:threonine dehydratase
MAGMTESLKAGKVITLPQVGLFADGAAVKTVGSETFRVCSQLVDEMVTVETDEICAAIKMGFNDTRCVMEPAGALAVAGMAKYARENRIEGQTFVAITSGANMDFDRLRFVSERADSSETLMSVNIPDRPGSFRQLYNFIYPRNVTEFCYRYNGTDRASVFMSFQALAGRSLSSDVPEVMAILKEKGFHATDLSGNEMAKAHARHLAGGHKGVNRDLDMMYKELVYRFEFPESPGALSRFLNTLDEQNQGWNITLFHYRNHGHDFGRVLVGLMVKPEELSIFNGFLKNLGYTYYDETNNSAYNDFLR